MILRCLALIWVCVSCSPRASRLYLQPYHPPNLVEDLSSETFNPKADILFVVDDSNSMGVHQKNLADNIRLFTAEFMKASFLDYNIAVVSTDMLNGHEPCCGRFVGGRLVVNRTTPDGDEALAANIVMGENGDTYEMMFDPIVAALTEPNLSGWNAGFLRPEAALALVFITDAEDQSVNFSEPNALYDFLLRLKKGDARKILSFGAIVPSATTDCRRDPSAEKGPAPEPRRLEAFLGLTRAKSHNVVSLCAKDYGLRMARFASEIVNHVTSIIYLSRAPVLSSLRVIYGESELPMDQLKGWSFDPEKNAVHLGPRVDWTSQPHGSRVRVLYNAAQFRKER